MATAYAAHGAKRQAKNLFNLTGLKRWSILNQRLPDIEMIKEVHIYDFDNTLFKTPLPNPLVWTTQTIGQLGSPDPFSSGGWWHNKAFLEAIGDGVEAEEARAWNGWWNEDVVKLTEISTKQVGVLSILMTGRGESQFSDLIKRMITSKNLQFDLVVLKPAVGPDDERFTSTMNFKQIFIERVLGTYKKINNVIIYEDRPKHVKQFKDFLVDYNRKRNHPNAENNGPQRNPVNFQIEFVQDITLYLEPVVEVKLVLEMVEKHNEEVASNPQRGGPVLAVTELATCMYYRIRDADMWKLLDFAQIPAHVPKESVTLHDVKIPICSITPTPYIRDQIGEIGSTMTWKVTGTANLQDKLWAARIEPVPHDAKHYTLYSTPRVVLATRGDTTLTDVTVNAITYWEPLPLNEQFTFETEIIEDALLRIESDGKKMTNDRENRSARGSNKRKAKDQGDNRFHRPAAPGGPAYPGRNGGRNQNRRGSGTGGPAGRGGRGGGARGGAGVPRGPRAGGGGGGRGGHPYQFGGGGYPAPQPTYPQQQQQQGNQFGGWYQQGGAPQHG